MSIQLGALRRLRELARSTPGASPPQAAPPPPIPTMQATEPPVANDVAEDLDRLLADIRRQTIRKRKPRR